MSTNIVNFICSAVMSFTGLIVMNKLCCNKYGLVTLKNAVLLLCLIISPMLIYSENYTYLYTIIVYILMIVTYKYIFNISFKKSLIGCGILIVSIIILEIIGSCILIPFLSPRVIRNTWYINIMCNVVISILLILIFYKTKVGDFASKFLINVEYKRYTSTILFFILMVIAMSIILYSITINFQFNKLFKSNFVMFLIFFLLVIILFKERNSYDKLVHDYDNLFDCVNIFEEWIEKEQFMRHEYKNQLAVLRCLTKDKKVKDKIDGIIADSINIDDGVINELKYIPNGGIKGLLYYKIAIANNKNISIEIDVSSKVTSQFKKLNKSKIEIISKLLGVYCDNAIEAALETKRKLISVEVYTKENDIVFVISNTYDTKSIILNADGKGNSSKGSGRGNGLYFASKLLSKNKWIEENKKITKDFYIQKIIIKTQ